MRMERRGVSSIGMFIRNVRFDVELGPEPELLGPIFGFLWAESSTWTLKSRLRFLLFPVVRPVPLAPLPPACLAPRPDATLGRPDPLPLPADPFGFFATFFGPSWPEDDAPFWYPAAAAAAATAAATAGDAVAGSPTAATPLTQPTSGTVPAF